MRVFLQLSGMSHPLACRVCGVMTYLYDGSKQARERSLVGAACARPVVAVHCYFYCCCVLLLLLTFVALLRHFYQ